MNFKDKHNFIIRYGILEWGIPAAIIYAFLITLKETDLNKIMYISEYFLLNILICCIAFSAGGYFFGYFLWRKNKNSIKK